MTTDKYGPTILLPVADQNISASQFGVTVRAAIIDLDARLQDASSGLTGSIRKQNVDTVTNTTSLHTDSELALPISANITYMLDAFLIYNVPSGNDFKFGFNVSGTGSSDLWTPRGLATGATTSSDSQQFAQVGGGNTASVGGVTGVNLACSPIGIVFGGTVDGTVSLTFAESVAAASTSAQLLAGSWMRLTPM